MVTTSDTKLSFFVFSQNTNTGKITKVAIPADTQIGLAGNPASLDLFGRLSLSVFNAEAGPRTRTFQIKNEHTVVSVNVANSAGLSSIDVYLPQYSQNGQLHIIKDNTGTAGTVTINVYPIGKTLIDGVSSKTITTAYGSMLVYWNNDHWSVFQSSGGGGGGGPATQLIETSGPTTLTIAGIADGEFFKRSGTTVIGAASPGTSGPAGGDLTGTYPNPTVAKIKATTITTAGGALTTGKVLRVTGVATADWGAINLANTSAVTGELPITNIAPGTNDQVMVTNGGVTSWGQVNLASTSAVTGSLSLVNIKSGSNNQVLVMSGSTVIWGTDYVPGFIYTMAGDFNTGFTGYQRMASWLIDATNLTGSNLTLTALLETTNITAQAQFQLFNVSLNTSVATLSSSALTAEKQFTTLTVPASLPAAEYIYEIRLKAGLPGYRVTCTYASLKKN